MNLHHQQMFASRIKFEDRIEGAELPPKSYPGLKGALYIREESQQGDRYGLHVRDSYGGSRRLDREIGIINLHHQQMFASRIKFGDMIEGAKLPPKSYRDLKGVLSYQGRVPKG